MKNKFLTADYTLIQIQSMRWLKQKLKTFVFKGTVLKKCILYCWHCRLTYTVHEISQ